MAKLIQAEWDDTISLKTVKNYQGESEVEINVYTGYNNSFARTRLNVKQALELRRLLSDLIDEIVFGPIEQTELADNPGKAR